MAANGAQQAFAPVLAALETMQSTADRANKDGAHEFLESFQKSVGWLCAAPAPAPRLTCPQENAWQATFAMLQSDVADPAAQLFAATTLKGKVRRPAPPLRGRLLTSPQIVYDLHQLPREQLPSLRDTILSSLAAFRNGPKPIRVQLCVCLANLAIQMTEWKNVFQLVLDTLGSDSSTLPCVLDFLRVLPEEVTEGRKINLSVRHPSKHHHLLQLPHTTSRAREITFTTRLTVWV